MTNQDNMGFKGLFSIYPKMNLLKSATIPFFIDIVLIITIIKFKTDIYNLIVFIAGIITSVIPNVLGFILTGYAVIISVTETKYLKIMVKRTQGEKISLYQIVNSTFAFVLLSLSVTLIVGIIINIIVNAKLVAIDLFANCLCRINILCLFVLIFLLLYSLFAILDVIINIFDFGQFINRIEENT